MLKRYGCAIAMALMVAGAGAGCGDDDEEALSKAEYIKQGDAICKKAGADLEKEVEDMFPDLGPNEEPTEEQLTTFVDDAFKPNADGQLDDLRDLPPPEGDEDTLNGIYDGFEEAVATVEDDPTILLEEDDPFEAPSQEAADYGFKDCSE